MLPTLTSAPPKLDTEGIFDDQRFNPLAMLHAFALEGCAASFKRCRNDLCVVDTETVAKLNVEAPVVQVNAR
jgi:hypothetical protein